ncbi:hypothetical protein GLW08_03080 [Pontibacillus yanchengensis]|uniref:Uncharacterized protein n=2 Tax=Pontibacillus yanchengensis TaxID=462910 RepID=A0A6I5A454_9BACI|nr:hypothetical protein [Pontibacillus yanchengensis]MYL34699.1 hypothetical protein [Pontibacillus yanchengensis]MYL52316.1 hypothetical protein [Pontibacillus yanchengensis]
MIGCTGIVGFIFVFLTFYGLSILISLITGIDTWIIISFLFISTPVLIISYFVFLKKRKRRANFKGSVTYHVDEIQLDEMVTGSKSIILDKGTNEIRIHKELHIPFYFLLGVEKEQTVKEEKMSISYLNQHGKESVLRMKVKKSTDLFKNLNGLEEKIKHIKNQKRELYSTLPSTFFVIENIGYIKQFLDLFGEQKLSTPSNKMKDYTLEAMDDHELNLHLYDEHTGTYKLLTFAPSKIVKVIENDTKNCFLLIFSIDGFHLTNTFTQDNGLIHRVLYSSQHNDWIEDGPWRADVIGMLQFISEVVKETTWEWHTDTEWKNVQLKSESERKRAYTNLNQL